MSTPEEYAVTLRELTEADKELRQLLAPAKAIAEATSAGLTGYLATNYGLKRRKAPYENPKMGKKVTRPEAWPSYDQIDAAAKRAADAYNRMSDVWDAIPADDRAHLKTPPKGMDTYD